MASTAVTPPVPTNPTSDPSTAPKRNRSFAEEKGETGNKPSPPKKRFRLPTAAEAAYCGYSPDEEIEVDEDEESEEEREEFDQCAMLGEEAEYGEESEEEEYEFGHCAMCDARIPFGPQLCGGTVCWKLEIETQDSE